MEKSVSILGLPNVLYDKNSGCVFDQLNESAYIRAIFTHLQEAFPEFRKYNYHIISNQNSQVVPDLSEKANKDRDILFFISDEWGVPPEHLKHRYKLIFKMYLHRQKENMFPFPLGCVGEVPAYPDLPVGERKYNLFFSGNLNPNRLDFYHELLPRPVSAFLSKGVLHSRLWNRHTQNILLRYLPFCFSNLDWNYTDSIIRFTTGFKKRISPEEYGKLISQSKIVLCPKGFHSTECFRHYEALRQGCIVISEKLPDTVFYKNSPIIQLENWSDIKRIVRELLLDQEALSKISDASKQWWNEVLSERAVAGYIQKSITRAE